MGKGIGRGRSSFLTLILFRSSARPTSARCRSPRTLTYPSSNPSPSSTSKERASSRASSALLSTILTVARQQPEPRRCSRQIVSSAQRPTDRRLPPSQSALSTLISYRATVPSAFGPSSIPSPFGSRVMMTRTASSSMARTSLDGHAFGRSLSYTRSREILSLGQGSRSDP